MQKATKIAFLVIFAIAIAFSSIGCRQSFVETETSIIEDKPAVLTLKIDEGKFSSVATRAADDESKINCLALFVFNSKGKLLTRTLYDDAQSSSIKVRTFSGTGMRVVAVANYKAIAGLEEQLTQAANYDVLNDVVVTQSATSPGSSAGILMTGETVADITDSPSGTQVSLAMQYAVAKVTLAIKVTDSALPAGESLEIFNLAVASIATRGHLFAGNVEAEDRGYAVLESVDYDGNQTDGMTATFYVLENVRGGRKQMAPPSGLAENAGNGHLFKRHFAPDNSSYAVISANHRKDGNRLKRVDMYIYFGHNNSDNYNVARGENHTYSVRINGLNNINIDTNVETTDYNLNFGYGDNLNMDCHADSRALKFGKSGGSVSVEVIDNAGRRVGDAGFDATWLKVSPLDLMKHQSRSQKGNGSKGQWQQAGERYAVVRGKYIPHKSDRAKLTQGGWNEIPAGKDDDDRMKFVDATYRMCYAISDIALTSDREIVIYSAENTTQSDRSAQIEVSYTDASGNVHTELLPISQTKQYSVGVANGYQMMIESFEENMFNIYANPQAQLTKNAGMQWGYYNSVLYGGKNAAGDFLTANAVYGNNESSWVNGGKNFVQYDANDLPTWSDNIPYRSMYGSSDVAYKIWDNFYGQVAAPYYYPNYDSKFNTYAPIYNSSAARYCHEKNRDVNGDGVISPDEAHWFLPSIAEMKIIGASMSGLPQQVRPSMDRGVFYWSSSEHAMNSMAYAYDFSMNEVLENKKTTPDRVRCVRRGEVVAQNNVYVDGNGSVVVDNTSMGSDLITSTVKPRVPATESSDQLISSKFIIARSDISASRMTWLTAVGFTSHYEKLQLGDNLWPNAATGCNVYSELPDGSDEGKWRLPTRKELARVVLLTAELNKAANYKPMNNGWYWSVTEGLNNGQYNSWAVNADNGKEMGYERNSQYFARCIRQI